MLGQYIYLKQTQNNNPGYRPSAPKPVSTKSGFDLLPSQVTVWGGQKVFFVWLVEMFGGLNPGPRQTLSTQPSLLKPTSLKHPPYPAGSQEVQGRQKVTAMIPLVYLLPLRGKAHTEG